MRSVPMAAAQDISDLVEYVQSTGEPVAITQDGRRVAVLMSGDEYESVEETIYWLQYLDEVLDAERQPRFSLTKEQLLQEIHSRARRSED